MTLTFVGEICRVPDGLLKLHESLLVLVPLHQDAGHLNPVQDNLNYNTHLSMVKLYIQQGTVPYGTYCFLGLK